MQPNRASRRRRHTWAFAKQTAKVCPTTVTAKQWLDAGFNTSFAKAYVLAGCFDVDHTLDLKQSGFSILDIARSRQGWVYCIGHVSPYDLLEVYRLVLIACRGA